MARLTRDVGEDRRVEAALSELAQHNGAEIGVVERRRAQCDQWLAARLVEMLARRKRNPLRQHGQRAARLLILRQRPPLALKHRQRSRMEWIAGLEATTEKIPRFGFSRRGIDGHPFCRELMAALETPIGVFPRDPLADALVADLLEQPPADYFADLSLVIGEEVARDPAHDPGDPLLPQLIRVGHLDLAARQANDGGRPGYTRRGYRQVLDESMKALGHAAVAVDEIEDFVEQQQHRGVGGGEHPADRLGAGRACRRGGAERLDAFITSDLPCQVDPRCLASGLWVPGIADKHPDASTRSRGQSG
jgi:hypothetical protein